MSEHQLEEILRGTPCHTREDARRFVRLAMRAIQETRLTRARTPASLLSRDFPELVNVVRLVEEWIRDSADEKTIWEQCEVAHRVASRRGPFHNKMTGQLAACWSVYSLIGAVEATCRENASEVHRHANLTVMLALHAEDGPPTVEAIGYQFRLVAEVLDVVGIT